MVTKEEIERINELARKKKAEGLTPAELEEQAMLRGKYLEAFRVNLKSQLENIEIVEPNDPRLRKNRKN